MDRDADYNTFGDQHGYSVADPYLDGDADGHPHVHLDRKMDVDIHAGVDNDRDVNADLYGNTVPDRHAHADHDVDFHSDAERNTHLNVASHFHDHGNRFGGANGAAHTSPRQPRHDRESVTDADIPPDGHSDADRDTDGERRP